MEKEINVKKIIVHPDYKYVAKPFYIGKIVNVIMVNYPKTHTRCL